VSVRAKVAGRWLNEAWALVAALSLLTGVLAAGHRYFQCSKMGPVGLLACCDAGPADHEASIDADACCHPREFGSPERGFALAPPCVAPSPVSALLPSLTPAAPALTLPRSVDLRSARAGPARASPHDYRIFLTVSLT
jgi:hypothetical protein